MDGPEKVFAFVATTFIVTIGLLLGNCANTEARINVVRTRSECLQELRRLRMEPQRIAACRTACGEGRTRAVTKDGCECR